MSSIPTSTDVLIVGAGPTGLALSISLTQAGIDHVLVDQLEEGLSTSRAVVIHAHTLESLESIGVSDRLVDIGLKIQNFSISDRDDPLLTLRFDRLPSTYSYLLMVPQHVTEGVLAARLEEIGGRIERGVTAEGAQVDTDGVVVQLATKDGTKAIRARYVVGADGMHSFVRDAAGIAFEGSQYEETFVLADVRMDWPFGREEEKLFLSPSGPVVVVPMPDGQFKIVAPLNDAPGKPDVADIQHIIDSRGPVRCRAHVESVSWSSRFRLHHRIAETFRKGRFLLLGDAAHVHSPAGGQGMNTGLVDALTLGRVLAAVVSGKQPEHALDLYDQRRRPAAAKVLKLAAGLTKISTAQRPSIRNLRFRAIEYLPPVKQAMIMNLSGLGRRAASELPFP
jgi:2-polyprenyl-6-methoxyphenol hydroxylase-like FAD-dependent oxidoreductase